MPGRSVETYAESVSAAVGEVLGRSAAGLPADVPFQEIGATSLDMGRVCARLADVLGRPVPFSQIFGTPTIRDLADWLAATADHPPHPGDRPEPPAGDGDRTAPLSPMQSYMFLKHMFRPDDLSLHVVRSWRITGRPDRPALRAAVALVHSRHPFLSSTYQFRSAPYIEAADVPAPELRELIADTEDDARALLARELARPLRLSKGQVWHCVYVAVRQEHLTLFGFAVHHVALDGGAAGLMSAELATAYNARRAGTVPALPPVPDARRLAAARDAHLPYVDLDAQRAYWREAVADLTMLEYPGGPDAAPGAPCAMVTAQLPDGTVGQVRDTATRLGVTPFVVYLSAYAQAVAVLTGQSGFAVGTPMNRRADRTLSRAVSSCMDIVCLRPSTDPHLAPEQAVAATADRVARAFAAQDIAVPEVSELRSGPKGGARNPLFQNVFVFQDNDPGELRLDDVRAEFFRPGYPGVSSEIYAEVWPSVGGRAQLVVGYQPDRVGGEFCRRLAAAFTDRLAAYVEASDGVAA